FQRLAGRLGLPVPAALPLRPHLDPPPGALDIAFPVVVKPFVRRRAAWTPLAGTGKAVRADSPAELRALWPRLAAPGPRARLHLLEVNPRFTLWHHLGARAGLNVPALVHGDLTGRPRPPQQKVAVGARWSKPWDDIRAARTAGLSLPAWLWWTLGCDATRAFA